MDDIVISQDCVARVKRISKSIATFLQKHCRNNHIDALQLDIPTIAQNYTADVVDENFLNLSSDGQIKRCRMIRKQLKKEMADIHHEELSKMHNIAYSNYQWHREDFKNYFNIFKDQIINHYTNNGVGFNTNELSHLVCDAKTFYDFVSALENCYFDTAIKKTAIRVYDNVNTNYYHHINNKQNAFFNDENIGSGGHLMITNNDGHLQNNAPYEYLDEL